MTTKAPRGTRDLLPDETERWVVIETKARSLFQRYGFREVRPPIFEDLALFVRGIGEATDIVEKEMFLIQKGDSTFALRPEATASVVRAYLQANLHKLKAFQKLFYIGPMFRYERPQAARLRQFHQLGVEALGASSPILDAEVIELGAAFYEAMGLSKFKVHLNTLGSDECRARYRQVLKDYFAPMKDELCELCQARFERNIFRLLDCKNKTCTAKRGTPPPIDDSLSDESRDHFARVRDALSAVGRSFVVDAGLVRGLDYYTRTVFEYVHPLIGARSAIGGGGRYDNLIEELGGPSLGACGFALGFEATLLAMEKEEAALESPRTTGHVFLASADEDVRVRVFELAQKLRESGVAVEVDHEGRSLKAQMRAANRMEASYVAVLGPDEFSQGVCRLRDMQTSDEQDVPLENLADRLRTP